MKIEVGDLLKKTGKETSIKGEVDVSFPVEEINVRGPVRYALKLMNVGDAILVTGTLKGNVLLTCVRCLKEFETPLTVEVEEQYGPKERFPERTEEEVELKEKDFTFNIDEEGVIDLTEAIRQNLITALPIKPLCDKKCRGIGGQGSGIGESKKTNIDPRLSKLKDLLKK